jgi:dolichyl-phosphate-mannose--protein O-mannosyl transferase
VIGAGALAGLAIGSKWTGLAALGLPVACLMFGLGVVTGRASERMRQAAILVTLAFAVYTAGWIIHWAVLTNPGPGDAFYPTTGNLVQDFIEAQKTTWIQNKTFTATHPDASKPWTWPLMQVVPYFWQGASSSIYMLGNPIVWWGSFVVLMGVLLQLVVLRPFGAAALPAAVRPANPWVMLVGYLMAFVPMFPITRVMFLYHYLTPMLFGLAFALLWLDRAGWTTEAGLGRQRRSVKVVLAAGVIGFFLVMPLTYGFSAGQYDEWLAGLVRSWR